MFRIAVLSMIFSVSASTVGWSQTRDEKVRQDKQKVTEDGFWIYNDLDEAFRQARETGKPIVVVLRCIPCEECVKLDDDLVDKDPVIRPLLEEFVCARQVSTNGLDLSTFQYDTDQSFAVFFLNADGTIYGRFGTRSHRTEWLTDVSLEGLAKALQGALELHEDYPDNKAALAGKRGPQPVVASPEKYPSLKDKFTDTLNYEGDVAKSCIHCHQIGDAQRSYYWSAGQSIPEHILFPYPHPKSLGLVLDPDQRATVKRVVEGSIADQTGFEQGDKIQTMNGQPLLSMADVQWVLHQGDPDGDTIDVVVEREGKKQSLKMKLEAGWRRADDISWRVTSWPLRRMVTGGAVFEPLDEAGREKLGISDDKMALRTKSVGRYGPHGAAKRAGLQVDDVIIGYGDRDDLMREADLFWHALNDYRPGQRVAINVRRGDKKLSIEIPIQK